MRNKLIDKMKKDIERKGVKNLAAEIGIDYFKLYRIIHSITKGTIDSWEKIIKFYKPKPKMN